METRFLTVINIQQIQQMQKYDVFTYVQDNIELEATAYSHS